MSEQTTELKCECGRIICNLCEENRATIIMKNQVNGNKLNVCKDCYEEIWG